MACNVPLVKNLPVVQNNHRTSMKEEKINIDIIDQ